MSEEFFRNGAKTYIENWPSLLFNESMATAMFQLTNEEMNSLIEVNLHTIEETEKVPSEEAISVVRQLEDKLTGYIQRFPRGAFVKLGSRSPKDSWFGHKEGFCCHDGHKAIKLFSDSERINDDLLVARHYGYLPQVVVREWIEMPAWAEFRGFIKDRKLVGLSQYNYLDKKAYPEIIENADSIQWAIQLGSKTRCVEVPYSFAQGSCIGGFCSMEWFLWKGSRKTPAVAAYEKRVCISSSLTRISEESINGYLRVETNKNVFPDGRRCGRCGRGYQRGV